MQFPGCSFWVTETPFTQLKSCLKCWGLPRKDIWYVRGLLWNLVGNFGSRNYLKSDLFRLCYIHIYVSWHKSKSFRSEWGRPEVWSSKIYIFYTCIHLFCMYVHLFYRNTYYTHIFLFCFLHAQTSLLHKYTTLLHKYTTLLHGNLLYTDILTTQTYIAHTYFSITGTKFSST